MNNIKPETVDAYLNSFPEEIQKVLKEVRKAILETAPDASESISYGMPAYQLNRKPLVYFAGFKNHIGFYATPTGHSAFEKKLSAYKQGKGSVRFPLNMPMPLELIREIVAYRKARITSSL